MCELSLCSKRAAPSFSVALLDPQCFKPGNDGCSRQHQVLKRDLEVGHTIDFNSLSPAGRQAALALLEADEARMVLKDGRSVLKNHTPNPIVLFFTMGRRG